MLRGWLKAAPRQPDATRADRPGVRFCHGGEPAPVQSTPHDPQRWCQEVDCRWIARWQAGIAPRRLVPHCDDPPLRRSKVG